MNAQTQLHPLAYLREAERLRKMARLYAADGMNRTAKRLVRVAASLEQRT